MTKFSALLGSAAFIGAAALSIGSAAAFPNFGLDTAGPAFIITVGPSSTTIAATGQPIAYDPPGDDSYIGIINNSGAALSSIHLSSSTQDIFGFDADGIDQYGATPNATDVALEGTAGAYGGPNAYFTGIAPDFMSGDVNFIVPIANSGSDYFSLEEPLDVTSVTPSPVPEPLTLSLFGAGLAGAAAIRRRRKAKAV